MKTFEMGDRYIVRVAKYANDDFDFTDHAKFTPSMRAGLAMDMARKWGMVAGKPDGEDSEGRAKLGLLSPAEVVERAIETADLLMTEIEARDWMLPGLDPAELYDIEGDKP